MNTIHPLPSSAKAGALFGALAFFATASLHAQILDPDPELFDGASTKTEETNKEQQPTVDDWEHANLILYDSNEEGSQRGGMGRVGGQGPGMDMGSGGGMGGGIGLPLPIAGGGMGVGGSGLEIPDMQNQGGGGEESSEQTDAAGGGNPEGAQQGPRGQAAGGGRQPPQKPGEVSIGDDSKRIASAAAPLPIGDTEGLRDSEQKNQSDGGDSTQVPTAASGAQSGVRGGGVEKGDAMPADL